MNIDENEPVKRQLEQLHGASYAWSVTCCNGNLEEAADVLQTAYLKVLEGRAIFRGRSSLKTWFFSVVRRTAGERGRKRRTRSLLLGRWSAHTHPQNREAAPDERAASSERASRILLALAGLSERQRRVLDLVFYQEQTLREAAEVLGISVGSARVHYARGKKTLLRRLRDLR